MRASTVYVIRAIFPNDPGLAVYEGLDDPYRALPRPKDDGFGFARLPPALEVPI
jgi:hypothetical protein